MKIAIVGAGAMGSLFGGHLAMAGTDVTLVDIDAAHVDAICRDKLAMRVGEEEHKVAVKATTDPADVGAVDAIVMFCKYRHTADAIRAAGLMIADDTVVWTLQNGLGNVDLIADAVPLDRIAKGLTSMTAVMEGPGRVATEFRGQSESFLWPAGGEPNAAMERIVATFTAAGLPAYLDPDIDYRIWRKLVVNAGVTILSAAVNVGIGPVGEAEAGQRLLRATTEEVVAVAQAAGVPLDFDDAFGYLEELREKAFTHVGSTTIDLQGGRPTEIDAMCGAVVREGRRYGVPTPTNAVLTDIVKLIEETRQTRLPTPI